MFFTIFSSLMAQPFAALKGILALVLLGGLAFGSFTIYHSGYDKAERFYKAQLQAISDASAREVAREKEVNAVAVSEALKQVQSLQEENDNLNKELSDADVQAFKDRDAQHKCLGTDSVRRLNSISKHH